MPYNLAYDDFCDVNNCYIRLDLKDLAEKLKAFLNQYQRTSHRQQWLKLNENYFPLQFYFSIQSRFSTMYMLIEIMGKDINNLNYNGSTSKIFPSKSTTPSYFTQSIAFVGFIGTVERNLYNWETAVRQV